MAEQVTSGRCIYLEMTAELFQGSYKLLSTAADGGGGGKAPGAVQWSRGAVAAVTARAKLFDQP